MRLILLLLLSTSLIHAQQFSLAGKWKFSIDRNDIGIKEKWFTKAFTETIDLPGSMAERGKGDEVTLQTKWTGSIYDSSFFFRPSLAKYRTADNLKIPFWLTPAKYYVGVAWYQQDILIPAGWTGKIIRVFLERVHIQTKVWVDDKEIGTSNSLSTAQQFELGKLSPGKHTLTIRIDNSIKDMNVGPDSHSVADHTQGNWNGIVGKMYIEALPSVRFTDIQVYPDVKNKTALVRLAVLNARTAEQDVFISMQARSFNSDEIHMSTPAQNRFILKPHDTVRIEMEMAMGDDMVTWDEFDPNMYNLTATVNAFNEADTIRCSFGMRSFTISGTSFMINDRPVFLRGTLNNCEFPLTGYPAMDENAWVRIFRVAKDHGLNHMRFHSWCPPEAAFNAADRVGFYSQPEAPTWPNHGTSLGDGRFIDQYIYDETNRMAKAYGNHPSFCMLAAGNEPAGKNQATYLAGFVNYWKTKDTRRVYTGASVAMSWPLVPENQYMVKSGARGLKWTDTEPENSTDYAGAIKDFNVPYVTHEMGQWCVFPDFEEIKKYTGVYKARNLELFEQDLKDHGMNDQAKDFFMASGKLQVLCYKAEIEKDLRTKGLAGFQLLGLQDFPGQGTALIGTVNAFWDAKPYINARQWSRFCNTTVPLAKMKKFIFSTAEKLEADVELFHFGKMDLTNAVIEWVIKDPKGGIVFSGQFPPQHFTIAAAQAVGHISVALDGISNAGQYKLEVGVNKTVFFNDWDFWVYPAQLPKLNDQSIYYCTSLNDSAQAILLKGGKVFLDVSGKVVKGKEISMSFTPVFWNTSWFKMRPPHTLGLLIKKDHPAFAGFPTNFYSDYQWWSIVNKAQVMHLEDFPKGFKPLVQPIDTWFMNRKLGLIFEAKVGNGKLLVSSAPISDTSVWPASRQLFYSIKKYMLSDKFNPVDIVELKVIKDLFISPSRETWDSYTKQTPDELKPGR